MKMSWRSRVSTHAASRGCRGADLFFLFSPGIKSLCKSLNIQLVEITETVYGSRSLIYICTLPFLASNSPGGRSRPRGPTATRDAPLCSPLTHLIQQIQQCGPTFHTASRRPETTSPTARAVPSPSCFNLRIRMAHVIWRPSPCTFALRRVSELTLVSRA